MAELVPITRADWRDAAAIRVGEGQLRFVADYEPVALVILSKAFVRVGDTDWWPYLLKDDGHPVGVLALVDERPRNVRWRCSTYSSMPAASGAATVEQGCGSSPTLPAT